MLAKVTSRALDFQVLSDLIASGKVSVLNMLCANAFSNSLVEHPALFASALAWADARLCDGRLPAKARDEMSRACRQLTASSFESLDLSQIKHGTFRAELLSNRALWSSPALLEALAWYSNTTFHLHLLTSAAARLDFPQLDEPARQAAAELAVRPQISDSDRSTLLVLSMDADHRADYEASRDAQAQADKDEQNLLLELSRTVASAEHDVALAALALLAAEHADHRLAEQVVTDAFRNRNLSMVEILDIWPGDVSTQVLYGFRRGDLDEDPAPLIARMEHQVSDARYAAYWDTVVSSLGTAYAGTALEARAAHELVSASARLASSEVCLYSYVYESLDKFASTAFGSVPVSFLRSAPPSSMPFLRAWLLDQVANLPVAQADPTTTFLLLEKLVGSSTGTTSDLLSALADTMHRA